MKKLFLLLIFCATLSINGMNKEFNKKEKQITIQLKQRDFELDSLDRDEIKSVLPQSIVNQIEKIEKWPDWAKQTTAFALCSAYLACYLVFIGSHL